MQSAGKRHKKRHIKWDEETIQEHDKERGTRMKIEEPKTPYAYMSDEEQEIPTEGIEEKLKKEEFKQKRSQHYNEFQVMKRMREQGKLDED